MALCTNLSADGYRPISVAAVLLDLVRTFREGGVRARLTERLTDPIEWREKLTEVLAALTGMAVVVVLDAAERLLSADGDVRDRDLGALVRELAGRSGHGVTLVLTVADGAPQRIRRELPANVRFIPLDRGLPFDDTIVLWRHPGCRFGSPSPIRFRCSATESRRQ